MYSATTADITVTVEPRYLDTESMPDKNLFVWAYHVRIENNAGHDVQLLTRYWKITDAYGRTQEVRGDGVVGEQPTLRPGERFEYTSGAPLPTPSGIMSGSYEMQTPDGALMTVTIPAFSLDTPHLGGSVN